MRELLQKALNALEYHTQQTRPIHNTELAIDALREALAAPEPEPVALESVHLTRDTQGMCVVLVNGRVAIRDNGDIIDHMATLEWFAAPPAAPAVPAEVLDGLGMHDAAVKLARKLGHAWIGGEWSAAPVVPDGVKPVGYTDPSYLQVKQIGGFSCQYESFGLFTAPLYAAPVVREPLTKELLQRHALFAADAPPSSAVVLLSSLHRLIGIGTT